ncbi:glycine-rich domain-containing protein [Streptomyces sp. NPDC048248]|uniref:glycine-rich domain-containing protein n=1 Tax=Streptomyces sp. NPDC048248 TaxID=3365523 RepID=UPI003717D410
MPQSARSLLTDEQFRSVCSTVTDANPGMAEDMAGRIVEEGIKFVVACARFPGVPIAPSRIVDEGWHALILHTHTYAELCARYGVFVHHFPGYDAGNFAAEGLDRTRALIGEAGYSADPELWSSPDSELVSVAAKCQHSPSCGPIRPMPKPEWP